MEVTPERYLLLFAKDSPKGVKNYLLSCFRKHGLLSEEEDCLEDSAIVIGAPFKMLLEEVRFLGLARPTIS